MESIGMENAIAIIGMSGRFPKAGNIQIFWDNIQKGVEAISRFTEEELLSAGVPKEYVSDTRYVPAAGCLENVDQFDHRFFEYSPTEAQSMDPQQRLFLECAWECFEDAGYDPIALQEKVGVYAGMRSSSYQYASLDELQKNGTAIGFQNLLGTDKDYLASRLSYKLNLKGPSVVVQTACSTSLVAVHMACESIKSGECDLALAGGVAISVPVKQGYFYQQDMIFSPDGHCYAFDEKAQGTVGGNGIGIVLLKPLEKALEDGDHVYAVIRGTAVNNDGQQKIGYTAPSVVGQAEVVAEAISMAEIQPEQIGYIETHGTGTALGDPIEIEALTRAFYPYPQGKQSCALGTLKPNIGHLDTAAGIASLIKTILVVNRGVIPPCVNYTKPNPKIDFSNTPFYINQKAKRWDSEHRIAGVSSFGIGGTNAHVIVEQPPQISKKEPLMGPNLIVLSAHTQWSLSQMVKNLVHYLEENTGEALEDIAYTLGRGRRHFSMRLAIVASSHQEACEKLCSYEQGQPGGWYATDSLSCDANVRKDTLSYLERTAVEYCQGEEPDWEKVFPQNGNSYRRIPLPTYAFEQIRHWKEKKQEKREGEDFDTESELFDMVAAQIRKLIEKKQIGSWKLISRWVACSLLDLLKDLGAFEVEGERLPLEGFYFQTSILPRSGAVLEEILELLVQSNLLGKEDDEYFLNEMSYNTQNELSLVQESCGIASDILEEIKEYLSCFGDLLSSVEPSLLYQMQEKASGLMAHWSPRLSEKDFQDILRVLKSDEVVADLHLLEIVGVQRPTLISCEDGISVDFLPILPEMEEVLEELIEETSNMRLVSVFDLQRRKWDKKYNIIVANGDILFLQRMETNLSWLNEGAARSALFLVQGLLPGTLFSTILTAPWMLGTISKVDEGDSEPTDWNENLNKVSDASDSFCNDGVSFLELYQLVGQENQSDLNPVFTSVERLPILGLKYPFACPIYEGRLSEYPITGEYLVSGFSVIPFSFFLQLVRSVAKEQMGDKKIEIRKAEIFAPLLREKANQTTLQIVAVPGDFYLVKIFSKQEDSQWQLHFSAEIGVQQAKEFPLLQDKDFLTPQQEYIDGEMIYSCLREWGIEYSGQLREIDTACQVEKGAKLWVKTNSISWEAVIQSAAYLMTLDQGLDEHGEQQAYFPVSVNRFLLPQSYENKPYFFLLKRQESQEEGAVFSAFILDEDRIVVGYIGDLRLLSYRKSDLLRTFGASTAENDETTNIKQELQKAQGEKAVWLVEAYLVQIFSTILRIEPEEISMESDFIQMGLDSLLFLELNQILMRDLGLSLTAQEAFETPYLSALRDRIISGLGSSDQEKRDPVAAIGGEIVPDFEHRYEPFELTNVQYAYWIGRSGILDLGDVSCHFYFEVDRPELNVDQFNRSWNRVVRRHDMLRSVILPEGLQRILPETPYYEAAVEDFTERNENEIQSRLEVLRYQKSHQVISSDVWPMFDICICKMPDKVRILFSIELLNADVRSIQIIFEEVGLFLRQPEIELPELTLSFRDYIKAEKRYQETDLYQESKRYWLEKISTMPQAPDLQLARGLSEIREQRFSSLVRILDKASWKALKEKAAERRLTPSSVLLAVYGDVLGLWSKNNDFAISLAQFNRTPYHPEVNQIVGDFTSIMILDLHPHLDKVFTNRASMVQKTLWENLEHRAFDGVQVLREMARGKRSGTEALVPVVFTSILGMGEDSEELYPWAVLGEVGYFVSQTPQVWLDNQVSESKGELIISWDVIEELFPSGMLTDMLDTYVEILRRLAQDNQAWDCECEIELPKAQLQILKQKSPEKDTSYRLLQTGFLESAKQFPNRQAVIAADRTLTYAQLDKASNTLAHQLKGLGIQRNELVAILAPKGWEQAVAALAILRSGAAYLPIDMSLPSERVKILLEDSGANVVLVHPETLTRHSLNSSLTVILITSELLDAPPMPDLPQKNDPDDTAYVIYTSGSTGMPKGVVITHRGAVNTLLDVCNRFNITREDKVLALSALNFDLSVFDLFGLLSVGGSVIIPHVEKVKDPAHWWQLLQMHKITIWNSVPVLMEMLLDTPHEENPEYLRLVMLSGDWIPVSLPDAVMETFHNPQVISLGGATEASIWSVLYPIDKVEANWTSIPYGRAMENQTIYVLKDDLSQCPVWMTGELYIGGIGLAKGYWRDQEKTEKSFINHPKTGERLYRTGDYGRMRPDGNIEFQGRADSQVKIHGNRVELGEIENAIRSHEGIRDSAVEVIKEEGVDKIQAFLVPFPSSANQTLYTQEICKEEQMAKIHSELAKAAKQNAMSVSESALHDYPAYWEFMGRLADAVIANILLDMGVYQSDSDSYSLEEMIEHCEIDSQHQPMFAKWMERLCERKILEFVDGRYKQIEPIDPDILSDTLLTLLPVGSYWYSKAEQLLHYFQDIISIYPEMLHGEIDPRELLLDEDAPLTAKAMEQFDSLEEQVKNMLVSIVEQAMENIESETVTIMELGSLSGNLADTIVPNMDKEKYRYCYTHVSTVFLDEVRDALERPEDVEYQIYNFNAAPSTQGLQLHSVDILIAPNTLHRARNLALTLEHLKTLLKPGGIFFLYEETVNNPIQFITVGLFEKGFTEFTDERKTTFESLLSRERWTHEVEHAGMQVLGCYPQTDEETSIFGHSVFIIQGPVAVQRFDETKLEHYLREHLPNYMIPNAYCLLDKIPITENGKVSRKQLRQMVNHSLQTNWQGYCGPETDLEREISEIWKGVLGTKRDDVNEDFITLGGDSLQAVQLVNQIKKRYQLDFPLNRMFQNVTIRVLSAFVENGIKNKDVE